MKIQEASGASVRVEDLAQEAIFDVTQYGAVAEPVPDGAAAGRVPDGDAADDTADGACPERALDGAAAERVPDGAAGTPSPVRNTEAFRRAAEAASASGGGTVYVPAGIFKVYTVELFTNVNLYLSRGACLKAARTDIVRSCEAQSGEGGNYREPEANRYVGLQDHGHTYFANSLIYAHDAENIMIFGEGRIDGSYQDEETGALAYALQGADPYGPARRGDRGHAGEWFGNKAIALVRCSHVVLSGFSIVIGGHFAVIAEGVRDLLVERLMVDTNRDALDLDCCQDVTVVGSAFNSLTDDALVVKASFGAGFFMPAKNILIEDCVVSGFDAGSVVAGTPMREKLVATDGCGPTGRVKLGTESTCGYEQVTVRRVRFVRSRGFALEAVDGAPLHDILFEDCEMEEVSSSPIFIRAGDRGRTPVTGNCAEDFFPAKEGNVRLDSREWVLPAWTDGPRFPALRYQPSYRMGEAVTADGRAYFPIVDQEDPARVNEANLYRTPEGVYARKYDAALGEYVPDFSQKLQTKREKALRANACGAGEMASVHHILIRNVTVKNADPRYPILIMGLVDAPVRDVALENISVSYRGGLSMEQAVEQRQIFTNWAYRQAGAAQRIQSLPWLVNPFFAKMEGLLPRADWDEKQGCWQPDPYNVPELPGVYPEPSNWGILPAYGIYARHVRDLAVSNLRLETFLYDGRHAVVLDDVVGVRLSNLSALQGSRVIGCAKLPPPIALVERKYCRRTNREYLPEEPYFSTSVQDWKVTVTEESPAGGTLALAEQDACKATVGQANPGKRASLLDEQDVCKVTVGAPAPGTPPDSYYPYPTAPIVTQGYHCRIPAEAYPLPLTVYRPWLRLPGRQTVRRGEMLCMTLEICDPAVQVTEQESDRLNYNEGKQGSVFLSPGVQKEYKTALLTTLPGAHYDPKTRHFAWDTKEAEPGVYVARFLLDDGVLEEYDTLVVEIVK